MNLTAYSSDGAEQLWYLLVVPNERALSGSGGEQTMTQQIQPLLTPTSRALALSPPRSPPLDSWIHYLHQHCLHELLQKKESEIHHLLSKRTTLNIEEADTNVRSHELLSRLLIKINERDRQNDGQCRCCKTTSRIHHDIPLPTKVTRYIGAMLPLHWQHDFRDSGKFRSVADGLVKLTCPLVAAGRFREIRDFIELSSRSKHQSKRRWRREVIRYGDHEMQYVDLFWPNLDEGDNSAQSKYIRGTVFFVHGGAWGSGHPWMYRLVAPCFLRHGFVVAIVGYRTYPCVSVVTPDLDGAGGSIGESQLCDVKSAWSALQDVMGAVMAENKHHEGWVGNVLAGHSSGAHIALLMLVDMVGERLSNTIDSRKKIYPDCFVGLSGPYDISNHYDFEAQRGVEQISPMKAICGGSRDNFSLASPVSRMYRTFLMSTDILEEYAPPILLVHGIEDDTVPFTATADAARSLRQCGLTHCDEVYLEECGHQEVVMQFMLGGNARDVTMDYLFALKKPEGSNAVVKKSIHIKSRL